MFGTEKDANSIKCVNMELANNTLQLPYEDGCHKPLVKYAQSILIDGALMGFLTGVYQAVGIFVFYTFFKTLRHERSERLRRRVALQREMSEQGQHTQPNQANSSTPLVTPPPATTAPSPAATTPTYPTTPPVTTSA